MGATAARGHLPFRATPSIGCAMVSGPASLPVFRGALPLSLLRGVDCWIFDLDNTLYPASADLFGLIEARMGDFIAARLGIDLAEAKRLQKNWYLDHGTTLAGLMMHHGVDPHHFLNYVHDIPMDRLSPDPALKAAITALPGRRMVYTNGDEPYARRVLAALGLSNMFDPIHDIHACAYKPKPDPSGYALLQERYGIDTANAAMFEDMARNLKPARAVGMRTIWIDNGIEAGDVGHHPDHIDFETPDLTAFLTALVQELTQP